MIEDLRDWHLSLSEQFEKLRDQQVKGMVFALEHGLGAADIEKLKADVRAASRDLEARDRYWLPWVVYATEFGYGYSGEEYWQTFQAETPNWYGFDREWLRGVFKKFANWFSGAVPAGRWADQFTIICWPITHAILPRDLQVDLAHALHDARRSLTPEVLDDPHALGLLVEGRASSCSARFQQFATQRQLVGTIGSALIRQDVGGDNLIYPATLSRITGDLQKAHDAREWLGRARQAARGINVQRGGSGPPQPGPQARDERAITRAAVVRETGADLSPRLRVRLGKDGWELWLLVPEMRPLAATSASISKILEDTRVFVAGFEGSKRPRGSLLDGFSVELSQWPGSSQPVLTLERSSPMLDYLVSAEATLPKMELMLFKLGSENEGVLLSYPNVRQRRRYLVLKKEVITSPILRLAPLRCKGLWAYTLEVPQDLTRRDIQSLRSAGLRDILDVSILPVGKVPAGWDTEGDSVWLAEEHPRFAITCGFPAEVSLSLGDHYIESTCESGKPLFVELPALQIGEHLLEVRVASEELRRVETFPVDLIVREARSHASNVASPLRLTSDPPSPTMEELWQGRASLTLRGPIGTQVLTLVEVVTSERHVTRKFPSQLPIEADGWARIMSRLRKYDSVARAYDEARAMKVRFDTGLLGSRELEAFPEFLPLKWVTKAQGDVSVLRLIDQIGASKLLVRYYSFDTPDRGAVKDLDRAGELSDPAPGLYVASSPEATAGVIAAVPTRFHSTGDIHVTPRLTRIGMEKGTRGVVNLIRHIERWDCATVPGSVLAQIWRQRVLTVLEGELFRHLCGVSWSRRAPLEPWSFTTSELRSLATEVSGTETALSRQLLSSYEQILSLPLDQRVQAFGSMMGCQGKPPAGYRETSGKDEFESLDEFWLPEFVMRLTSEPHRIYGWAGRFGSWGLEQCFRRVGAVRAARFLVHALDCMEITPEIGMFKLHANWGWK